METVIRQSTVAEVRSAPNIGELLAEYAAESHIPEIGLAEPQWDIYELLESAGNAHIFAAWRGENLVGVIVLLVSVLPHYGVLTGSTESFFVAADARDHGTGIRLLRYAETAASALGAKALLVSAPAGGRLERVMPALGYRHSNTVFVRGLV